MRAGSRPKLALTLAGAVAAATVAVGAAPAMAATPSGGPILTSQCNKYTNTPDGGKWQDDFDGLVDNYDAGYRVTITYIDPTSGDSESSYDENYWYPDPDTGSYHHTYSNYFGVPVSATSYTWSLSEFANGNTYDDILTGSGIVGGPNCNGKPKKPTVPTIAGGTIKVTKKGKFSIEVTGDTNVTGSVAVSNAGGQLASKGYHSGTTSEVAVTLSLGKKDLKHLEKVGSSPIKIKATATNHAGTSKASQGATLKGPKIKRKKKR